MLIETEITPNPATIKFLPGRPVMESGTADFDSAEAAEASPLASRLFELEDIERVFLGSNFISVTKKGFADWALLKALVMNEIVQHFITGMPVIDPDYAPAGGEDDPSDEISDDDSESVKTIKEILDTRVRPAVAADGGDIRFVRFEEGVVYLKMQGACAGCPSSTATLKMGIENMLKHFVPDVARVEAVNP